MIAWLRSCCANEEMIVVFTEMQLSIKDVGETSVWAWTPDFWWTRPHFECVPGSSGDMNTRLWDGSSKSCLISVEKYPNPKPTSHHWVAVVPSFLHEPSVASGSDRWQNFSFNYWEIFTFLMVAASLLKTPPSGQQHFFFLFLFHLNVWVSLCRKMCEHSLTL